MVDNSMRLIPGQLYDIQSKINDSDRSIMVRCIPHSDSLAVGYDGWGTFYSGLEAWGG